MPKPHPIIPRIIPRRGLPLIAGLFLAIAAMVSAPAHADPATATAPSASPAQTDPDVNAGLATVVAATTPAKPSAAGDTSPQHRPCSIRRFDACVDIALETANENIVRFLIKIPLLLLALLIVLLANGISKFLSNRLQLLRIRSQNPYMSGLVRTIVRTAVLLIGVLIALDLLNWTPVVSAVLGSAGVVGLVLGFAFRDIAENYIAGILLSVRRPFEPGDHIAVEGREGKVISVNSRATVLMTMDGNHLQLPNSLVFKSVVLNYSRNPKRRFEFTMLIDGSQSIRRAQTLAMATIAEIEGVLDDPSPSWSVVEYGAGGISLRFHGWVDQHQSDLGKVRSEAIRRVKAAFAHAGIEAPRTVYHIVSSRSRDAQDADSTVEPLHNGMLDTSVNREIDRQIAQTKAETPGVDMLRSGQDKPAK